ncbi:MAG TPA: hypothetical protein VEL77_09720 [Rugosimonospora sp.]|nr:hypothetical protein [Rugosimonospora sp.]
MAVISTAFTALFASVRFFTAGNGTAGLIWIFPSRSSLNNATRQLMSFRLSFNDRQFSKSHTRRDNSRRDISGSWSTISWM